MQQFSSRALDSEEIHERLRDNSDSLSEFSQGSDIGIYVHIEPDAEIDGPYLSDGYSNSDDGQVNANVGCGGCNEDCGACGCNGSYNDKD